MWRPADQKPTYEELECPGRAIAVLETCEPAVIWYDFPTSTWHFVGSFDPVPNLRCWTPLPWITDPTLRRKEAPLPHQISPIR